MFTLGLRVDVAHDAEEVARVCSLRQRLGDALALEDRDAVDDCIRGVTGDREADVAVGIE